MKQQVSLEVVDNWWGSKVLGTGKLEIEFVEEEKVEGSKEKDLTWLNCQTELGICFVLIPYFG